MKKLKLCAVMLCALMLFAACNNRPSVTESPGLPGNQSQNAGAQLAFIAPQEEYQGVFIQAVWSAVEQFAGKEGYSKAPYKMLAGEEDSTIQLAVKSGARLIVLAGTGTAAILLAAQNTYPEINFVLVQQDAGDLQGIKNNSAVLGFRPEQAGWLAGYMAMYEAGNNFAYFETDDVVARRYALGFFFGAEAAAETLDLAADSVDISPIYINNAQTDENIKQKIEASVASKQHSLVFANHFAWQDTVLAAAQGSQVLVVSTGYDYISPAGAGAAVAQSCPGAALAWVLAMWKNAAFPGGQLLFGEISNLGAKLYFEESTLAKFNAGLYKQALNKFASTAAGEYMQGFVQGGYVPSPQEIVFARIKPGSQGQGASSVAQSAGQSQAQG